MPWSLFSECWVLSQIFHSCLSPSSRGFLVPLQFSSVTQLCPTLCNPMDYSTPDFPAHYQIPEPTQTHVHHVGDAIKPSHPLSSPSPPAFNLSQLSDSYQMSQFFTSSSQSIGVAAWAPVLPMNMQDWFSLGWIGWISLKSKGLSRVFSNTTVQKHQFFSTLISFLFCFVFKLFLFFFLLVGS